jgi:Glycine rich protein/Secretion system C-terminal sorting domain
MRTLIIILSLLALTLLIPLKSFTQCISVPTPNHINTLTELGNCGATVNYVLPEAIDICGGGNQIFSYTGSEQIFVVPVNVFNITIEVFGAQGGDASSYFGAARGGKGGYVKGEIQVTPGQQFEVYVGGSGVQNGQGGYNGGGQSGSNYGSSGGGASDVRILPYTLYDRIIVAGGGGGCSFGSYPQNGGDGGGLIGYDGFICGSYNPGTGGTQIQGGVAGSNYGVTQNGGFGYGGGTGSYHNAGGGGGWYGGGSGACHASAAGGSSYVNGVSNAITSAAVNSGDGVVLISWETNITVVQISGLGSGSFFPKGTTIEAYRYFNDSGDSLDVSFVVNVVDQNSPIPDYPSLDDIEVECSVIISDFPTATDNCDGIITAYTNDSLIYQDIGEYFIHWIYEDLDGNVTIQEQIVRIMDNHAPSFDNILDQYTCDGIISNSIAPNNVNDNCSSVSITYELCGATIGNGTVDASLELYNYGVTTVTYFFEDVVGNISQMSFNVISSSADATVTQQENVLIANELGIYKWYDVINQEIVIGENLQTFTPSNNGTYALIITQGNCIDTSMSYIINSVGMESINFGESFNMYPNPAKSYVNIDYDKNYEEMQVAIYDMLGKLVCFEEDASGEFVNFDISNLSEGVYTILFQSCHFSCTKKLVVQ